MDIEGEVMECPRHSRFNIFSGHVTVLTGFESVAKHNVRTVGDDVEIEV